MGRGESMRVGQHEGGTALVGRGHEGGAALVGRV